MSKQHEQDGQRASDGPPAYKKSFLNRPNDQHESNAKKASPMISLQQHMRSYAGAEAPRHSIGLAAWLLLMVYPLLTSLGTFPVPVGDDTASAEFLFAILCTFIFAAQIGSGRLKLVRVNRYFLLGLVVWLVANVMSILANPAEGGGMMVFRMLLKALFGYMVFVVLMDSGRLKTMLEFYVVGCVLSGLFSIAFCLKTGDLETLRQASYAGLDPNVLDVDVLRGIARAGAGNLLPLWICIVLYTNALKRSARCILLALLPYFVVLSLLALRREVLIESVVVILVLIAFTKLRRNRIILVVTGLILTSIVTVVVTRSERWMERLFTETRYEFETGSDPRTVLLLNTPEALMEKPLIGHGPGSYAWRMSVYFPRAMLAEGGIGAHNSFSRVAVETGALGLIGFTVMFAALGALGWRAVRARSEIAGQGIMLRVATIMIFLHVGDWLFFGDGIALNSTWYFIGVLLYLDRCLSWEENRGLTPPLRVSTAGHY